jgi:hypothetical protein
MKHHRTIGVFVVGLAALVAGGCDKGKEQAGATSAPATTAAPAATSAPAATTAAAAATSAAPSASASAPASASAVAEAPIPEESTKIYGERCALCHGKDGKGNPPTAAGMKPAPRNFTDAAWQGQAKDDDIKLVILKGGTAVKKSASMPPNPDLESKPDVVDGLRRIVRGFKS